MNWRGRPLESHEAIVNTIAATTTPSPPSRPTMNENGAGQFSIADNWSKFSCH
jgi:hypothetical protein